jgi:2-polyprenyl-6-hydroxyphenyl methylase/3-demethylubiquinone-9 3-methyltransferase
MASKGGEAVLEETRFSFGENWSQFLKTVDDYALREAEQSLCTSLGVRTLEGKSFLDIGSGSGLFSLAAWRLGARVCSFDIDEHSVECTRQLRMEHADGDPGWQVKTGSALDRDFLNGLGRFDVVYSWGVLHHTGNMWNAIENAIECIAPTGQFFIAIYNDQGPVSLRWRKIKKLYNRVPRWFRWMILSAALLRIWGPTTVRDFLRLKPFHTWRTYKSNRGMNAWRDVVDWVGGYPFEVAKPEEIIQLCNEHDLRLTKLRTCGGGRGCNEFVFSKDASNGRDSSPKIAPAEQGDFQDSAGQKD